MKAVFVWRDGSTERVEVGLAMPPPPHWQLPKLVRRNEAFVSAGPVEPASFITHIFTRVTRGDDWDRVPVYVEGEAPR
jgi:hypothetical protein